MKNITELLGEIIPPNNYEGRGHMGSNHSLIDSLKQDEKKEIERRLISLLAEENEDFLIAETLAYMKSIDALPSLELKLRASTKPEFRIQWASSINQIKQGDIEMKNIAFEEFQNVSNRYSLIGLFYILAGFNDKRINERIQGYQKDKDYLIAYNALTALGQDTKKLVARERAKNTDKKSWWKFW